MASASEDLFTAIDAGDVDRVRTMLDADPSLAMARDHEGVSALLRARYRLDRGLTETVKARVAALDVFEAATFGDLDRLAVLLAADPSLADRRSGDGFTALHLAAFFGQDDAVRLLLARGTDPDARGMGWMTGTPLNSAASARHAATVDLLLEAGADPDAVQRGGWTPLHSAAHNGDPRTVELLLAHGADPAAIDDEGRSVADLAAESGDAATIAAIAGAAR
ncbi:MAG: ankyrin repeat domain-containing protein [Actinobacteria bacterium]|nr:MAG: ankyrin repeat domain-containing protein [Actinomycetota bacterium]